ncbi:MAG: hypothetical protein K5697_13475 [Lachnospiraceae bacterium]|nr:hypothetical protein [Lachnospiraceae bacterium]
MKDSLWEKKTIKEKDEKTGEETEKEGYDWKSITKALKTFIDDYNATVEGAGESNNKNVLRNAAWMTRTTSMSERLLSKVGISVGSGNKLELDEDKLKEADISTLYTIARNLCIDEYRRVKPDPLPDDYDVRVSGINGNSEDILMVRDALFKLPVEDQEILLLRHVNNEPIGTIGCSDYFGYLC